MANKIFRSTVFVVAVVLICSLGIVAGILYSYYSDVWGTQLRDELKLAATATEQFGIDFLDDWDSSHLRITWIGADGTVLFDTQADPAAMENHTQREEFQQALRTGTGNSRRTSSTLARQTLYEAQLLKDGTVLRVSTTQDSVIALLAALAQPLLLILAAAALLSFLLAKRMTRKILQPLNELDLEQPLKNDVYEEISPLLHRIHQQHNQIASQMETLRRRADEFAGITANMQEGLVLLDCEANVLSINPAARRIFQVWDDCIGRSLLQIDRSQEMRNAVNDALDKGRGTCRTSHGHQQYRCDLSRITSDGKVIGAVVLAFDITQSISAEQLRREFSANVSHELKTPLQSIIGSAELLENGLVKEADIPRFVGRISQEAARLVALIEDIIRLSQLDEGVAMPTESVELLTLAEEVRDALAPGAAAKGVTVHVAGTASRITGVRRLLYEILYNLCDNAIKYNIPEGSVEIRIEKDRLSVSDTGIGIPPEHQDRIFERFYRVDKSHSRQSGGTGLGLSIVKHAAAYHNALLELESEPGKGTRISVIF